MPGEQAKPRGCLHRLVKLVVLLPVLLLFVWWIDGVCVQRWTAVPPPLPGEGTPTGLTVVEKDGRAWLGESWLGFREGLPLLYLKGSSFAMGYANAVLTSAYTRRLENDFMEMVKAHVPSSWGRQLLYRYILFRNRNLAGYIPDDLKMEILGISLYGEDRYPEWGPRYHRVLNYHAAHDISHMLIDNPFVLPGCTAFGVDGSLSSSGHLITGRNFDWEAADVFSRDRMVIYHDPDEGIPFISLSWAGFAGCVSGMNKAGVSVTINGARTSSVRGSGIPVSLVVRQVLQRAHNLEEATRIIREARVFVSDLFLVGSRQDGHFIVIEKTPSATWVRQAREDGSIVCGNHFESKLLDDDPDHVEYREGATSVSRSKRLQELLDGHRGRISPELAVYMLRDRYLPGSQFKGNGHRGSINPLIATHATVMDLNEGIFWAATPPHQLGPFVAFDVNDINRDLAEKTIPADDFLNHGEFTHYIRFSELLSQGKQRFDSGEYKKALELFAEARKLNYAHYEIAWLMGRAYAKLGEKDRAVKELKVALQALPAFKHEHDAIKKQLYLLQ